MGGLNYVKEQALRRFQALPRWPALVAGIVLVAVGQWIQYSGGLEALRDFFYGVLSDLGLIQPFSVIPVYFNAVSGCEHGCEWWQYLLPQRYFGGLFTTVAEIWAVSGWAGRILMPLSVIIGFMLAMAALSAVEEKMGGAGSGSDPIRGILATLLTPFFASVVALVLQWLAMGMFFVFGAAMSALILILAFLAVPLAIWRAASSAEAVGHKVQQASDFLQTPKPAETKPVEPVAPHSNP